MKGITFVAMLFVAMLCCLLLGGMALYEHIEFAMGGKTGVMVSDDPLVQKAAKANQLDAIRVSVKYLTADGETPVPDKTVRGQIIKRLADGQRIPVAFMPGNPYRVRYDNEPLPNPWGWLAGAVVMLATALYAKRLLVREAT